LTSLKRSSSRRGYPTFRAIFCAGLSRRSGRRRPGLRRSPDKSWTSRDPPPRHRASAATLRWSIRAHTKRSAASGWRSGPWSNQSTRSCGDPLWATRLIRGEDRSRSGTPALLGVAKLALDTVGAKRVQLLVCEAHRPSACPADREAAALGALQCVAGDRTRLLDSTAKAVCAAAESVRAVVFAHRAVCAASESSRVMGSSRPAS
jgi:hypothetical protein